MTNQHGLVRALILTTTTLFLASCGHNPFKGPKPPTSIAAAGAAPAATVQRRTVFTRAPSADEITAYIRSMAPEQRSSSIKIACGKLRPWEAGYRERLLEETIKLPKGHIFRRSTVDLIDARCANEICRGEVSPMCQRNPVAKAVAGS
jgi:hypothetical protein